MQNYEYLGKPFQIGRLTIKNRFCMAPIGGGQRHPPGGNLIPDGSHGFKKEVRELNAWYQE